MNGILTDFEIRNKYEYEPQIQVPLWYGYLFIVDELNMRYFSTFVFKKIFEKSILLIQLVNCSANNY